MKRVSRLVAVLSVCVALPANGVEAQETQIDLRIDDRAVRQLLYMLDMKDTSAATVDELLSLPATRAVLRNQGRAVPEANDAAFKAGLRTLVTGEELKTDPFLFKGVRERLPGLRTVLTEIEADSTKLQSHVTALIAPYLPAGTRLSAKIVLAFGGGTDGWASGDSVFYMALDQFNGDLRGVELLAAHEVFHLAQARFMPATWTTRHVINLAQTENLLIVTQREGASSLLANPLTVSDGGAYVAWFQQKFRSNERAMTQNFFLADLLLVRAYDDSTADFAKLYQTAFSNAYGSPLYFVGMRMAQTIERYDGRRELLRLYTRPAVEFFQRYVALSHEHPRDPQVPHFGARAEGVIAAMASLPVVAGTK